MVEAFFQFHIILLYIIPIAIIYLIDYFLCRSNHFKSGISIGFLLLRFVAALFFLPTVVVNESFPDEVTAWLTGIILIIWWSIVILALQKVILKRSDHHTRLYRYHYQYRHVISFVVAFCVSIGLILSVFSTNHYLLAVFSLPFITYTDMGANVLLFIVHLLVFANIHKSKQETPFPVTEKPILLPEPK